MADKEDELRHALATPSRAHAAQPGTPVTASLTSPSNFLPYVRIGDKIMSIAEASKPRLVPKSTPNAGQSPGAASRGHRSTIGANTLDRTPAAASIGVGAHTPFSSTVTPTAPITPKSVRADTSRNPLQRSLRLHTAETPITDSTLKPEGVRKAPSPACAVTADASFASGRCDGIDLASLRRMKVPSFLETLAWSTSGKFSLSQLKDNGFVYLQVLSSVYDVRLISGSETTALMHDVKTAALGYLTVSQSGVSHMHKDGMDFYPLDVFELGFSRYQRVRMLKFFRVYRVWRSFYGWRTHVVKKRFQMRKTSLHKTLFLLSPTLREALLQVRSLCLHITQLKLFQLDAQTRTLRDWLDHQEKAHARMQQSLAVIVANIRKVVLRASAVSLDSYMAQHGFTAHPLESVLEDFHNRGEAGPSQMGPLATFARKLTYNTTFATPKDVKYTMRAAARSHCRRLMRFVRLSDLAIFNALLQLAYIGTTQLLSAMTPTERKVVDERRKLIEDKRKITAMLSTELHAQLPTMMVDTSDVESAVTGVESFEEIQHLFEDGSLLPCTPATNSMIGLYFVPSVDTVRSRVESVIIEGLRVIANGMTAHLAASEDFRALREAILSKADGTGDDEPHTVQRQAEATLEGSDQSSDETDEEDRTSLPGDGVGVRDVTSHAEAVGDLLAATSAPLGPATDGQSRANSVAGALNLLLEDQFIQSNMECISKSFSSTFDIAIRYASTFQHYRAVVLLDAAMLWSLSKEQVGALPVVDIHGALEELHRQQLMCDGIPESRDIDQILRVDSSRLRKQVFPSPARAREALIKLLPPLAAEKASSLFSDLLACITRLKVEPTNVDEYVQLLKSLLDVQSRHQDLLDREEWLKDLRKLLEAKLIPVSDETRSLLLSVADSGRYLRELIASVEDKQEANTSRFARELDTAVPKLKAAISEARRRSDDFMVHRPTSPADETVAFLEKLLSDVRELTEKAITYMRYQELLRLPVLTYDELSDLQVDVEAKLLLWRTVRSWFARMEEWLAMNFLNCDMDALTDEVNKFAQTTLQCERQLIGSPVVASLRDRINAFKGALPALRHLRSPCLKARHLHQLKEILSLDTREPGTTVGFILRQGVTKFILQLEQVAQEAAAERKMDEALNRVLTRWNQVELHVQAYSSNRDAIILADPSDVQALLQDSILELTTMMGSRFVAPLRVNVESLLMRLVSLSDILDVFVVVQHHWMFLEGIFASVDVQRAIPNDAKMFAVVDTSFRDIMRKMRDDPMALSVATRPALLDSLRRHETTLETIRSQLDVYLDSKRQHFPRLYFLSNDELLNLLSHGTSDLAVVNRHLPKLFDAISRLHVDDGKSAGTEGHARSSSEADVSFSMPTANTIQGMISPENEQVQFQRTNLRIRGGPEDWLRGVEDAMKATVKSLCRQSLIAFENSLRGVMEGRELGALAVGGSRSLLAPASSVSSTLAQLDATGGNEVKVRTIQMLSETRIAWMMENIAQVVSVVSHVLWTRGTEEALRAGQPPAAEMFPVGDQNKVEGERVAPMNRRIASNNSVSAPSTPLLRGGRTASFRPLVHSTTAMGPLHVDLHPLAEWFMRIVTDLIAFTHVIRGAIPPNSRKMLVAMITATVHFRDVVEKLLEHKSTDCDSFAWQTQLRYYMDLENGAVSVRHGFSSLLYGFEYQGCNSRLVVTPLTERCWLTLTSAFKMKLGAACSGPAGTGKTESCKDLAKALGTQCIVFNCSDQIDAHMLGRLFSGIAQTGAWACLDEFNRLNIDVLSIISSQLQLLRHARQVGLERTFFEGKAISLKDHNVIVTYNPGYADRTSLPDNLKALFRPCAMIAPDCSLIIEISLAAEGFEESKFLSQKVSQLFSLAARQLSVQQHYDWGLRAIKPVLLMAGRCLRDSPDRMLSEESILVNATVEATLPKLLNDDTVVFLGLVLEVFPLQASNERNTSNSDAAFSSSARLANQLPTVQSISRLPPWATRNLSIVKPPSDSLPGVLGVLNLQPAPKFLKKLHQLHYTTHTRFGTAVMGPAGSGKSSLIDTLTTSLLAQAARAALQAYALPRAKSVRRISSTTNVLAKASPLRGIVLHSINPKALSLQVLFGSLNAVTNEWQDGVLSRIMRDAVQGDGRKALFLEDFVKLGIDATEVMQRLESGGDGEVQPSISIPCDTWVRFDGSVDSIWVESLNSVLDDSRTLCLPSNERIKLPDTMRILFEVVDLAQASPATVSRLGIVHITGEEVSIHAVMESFLSRTDIRRLTSDKVRSRLLSFLPMIEKTVQYLHGTENHFIGALLPPTVYPWMGVVTSCLNMLYAILLKESKPAARMLEREEMSSDSLDVDRLDDPATITQLDNALALLAIDRMFAFSVVWSFGASLGGDKWKEFDVFLRDLFKKHNFDPGVPSSGTVFDFYLRATGGRPMGALSPSAAVNAGATNVYGELALRNWQELLPPPLDFEQNWNETAEFLSSNDAPRLSELFVPTVDTVRIGDIIKLLYASPFVLGTSSIQVDCNSHRPVLLSSTGVAGKSAMLQRHCDAMQRLARGIDGAAPKGAQPGSASMHLSSSRLQLSPLTSVSMLQRMLLSPLERTLAGAFRARAIASPLGNEGVTSEDAEDDGLHEANTEQAGPLRILNGFPVAQRRHIIWLDDVGSTEPQFISNAFPALELMRQVLERGGFHDERGNFTKLFEVLFLASSTTSYKSTRQLPLRLSRHFHQLSIPALDQDQLSSICKVLVSGYFHTAMFGASFNQEVRKTSDTLVAATLHVVGRLVSDMKPTPVRFHYSFTPHEVFRVFDGICSVLPHKCENSQTLVRLWSNEVLRAFVDRMSHVDQQACCRILSETVSKFFSMTLQPEKLLDGTGTVREVKHVLPESRAQATLYDPTAIPTTAAQHEEAMSAGPVLFGHFGRGTISGFQGAYEDMSNFHHTCNHMFDLLMDHNKQHPGRQVDVLLFRDAVAHVVRLCRVLNTYCGHAVLTGLTGVGRSTCLQLACILSNVVCTCMDVSVSSVGQLEATPSDALSKRKSAKGFITETGYERPATIGAHAEFRDKLKESIIQAGVHNVKVALMVPHALVASGPHASNGLTSDQDLVMEDLHHLISSCDVQRLFDANSHDVNDERSMIIKAIREQADKANAIEHARLLAQANQRTESTEAVTATSLSEADGLDNDADTSSSGVKTSRQRKVTSGMVVDPVAEVLLRATSVEDCFQIFLARVKANLHVVFCLSTEGNALRDRCNRYPSLLACCSWDSYVDWSSEGLLALAQAKLSDLPILPGMEASVHPPKEALAYAAMNIYLTVPIASAACSLLAGRKIHVTPRVYLEFLDAFARSWKCKMQRLQSASARLRTGIVTLDTTNLLVGQLKEQLAILQPILATKRSETSALLIEVETQKQDATMLAEKVISEEGTVTIQAQAAAELQHEAQRDLEAALPALNAAIAAVEALDKAAINEMKSYSVPPPAVRTVMEAVCVLLAKDIDWDSARRVLGSDRPTFQQMLQEFNKDDISAATLKRLARYTSSSAMTVESVKKVSVAAASIASWVHAVELYNAVAKEVAPKQAKLREMNSVLSSATNVLVEKRIQLGQIRDSLAAMQARMEAVAAEKERLEKEATTAQLRFTRANQLLHGLGTEGARWRQELAALEKAMPFVTGDVFLACAATAFSGAFPYDFRARLDRAWLKILEAFNSPDLWDSSLPVAPPTSVRARLRPILHSANYSLRSSLGDEVLIRDWHLHGLPKDDLSCDNALLVSFGAGQHLPSNLGDGGGRRWPFCIDPQSQAEKWILSIEGGMRNSFQQAISNDRAHAVAAPANKGNAQSSRVARPAGHAQSKQGGSEVISVYSPMLPRVLDACLRAGKSIVLKDCHSVLPTCVEHVVRHAPQQAGDKWVVDVCGKAVEYEPTFRLYMLCNDPQVQIGADVSVAVNIVDFTLSQNGLEEQLLGTVVAHEKPQVEAKAGQLVASMAADKKQLASLEDSILDLLTGQATPDSQGTAGEPRLRADDVSSLHAILDDTQLIATLQNSRNLAAVIAERVADSERAAASLALAREQYRPIAHRGAVLYFVLHDLQKFDPMYAYGLPYFQALFQRSLLNENSGGDKNDAAGRTAFVMSKLVSMTFLEVACGLYSRHVLQFAFCLAATMQLDASPSERGWPELHLLLHGSSKSRMHSSLQPLVADIHRGLPDTQLLTTHDNREKRGNGLALSSVDKVCAQFALSAAARSTLQDAVTNVAVFSALCEQILSDPSACSAWLSGPTLLSDAGPFTGMQDLHRLLLLRIFAPHRLLAGMKEYVHRQLGPEFTSRPQTSMNRLFEAMSPILPALLLISEGYDPSEDIIRFAEAEGIRAQRAEPGPSAFEGSERLHIMSLGQGQGSRAEAVIATATLRGDWVLLQNCHLSPSWLPKLEKILRSFAERGVRDLALEIASPSKSSPRSDAHPTKQGHQAARSNPELEEASYDISRLKGQHDMDMGVVSGTSYVHANFRLFLTSAPIGTFPKGILNATVKWTNEPSQTMRENALRLVDSVLSPFFSSNCQLDGEDAGAITVYPGSRSPTDKRVIGAPDLTPLKSTEESAVPVNSPMVRLAYRAALLHTILRQRSKFGSLGFTSDYEFSDVDFECCLSIVQSLCCSSDFTNIQGALASSAAELTVMPALSFWITEIVYGGRVLSQLDSNVLTCLFRSVMYNSSLTLPTFRRRFDLESVPDLVNNMKECFYTFFSSEERASNSEASGLGLHANAQIRQFREEARLVLHDCSAATCVNMKAIPVTTQAGPSTSGAGRRRSSIVVEAQQARLQGQGAPPDAALPFAGLIAVVQEYLEKMPTVLESVDFTSTATSSADASITPHPPASRSMLTGLSRARPSSHVRLLELSDEANASIADQATLTAAMAFDPVKVVLAHECRRYNSLLQLVEQQLQRLLQVLHGEDAMDASANALIAALQSSCVPDSWKALSFASTKPLFQWFEQLCEYTQFFSVWAATPSHTPPFPLRAFMTPHSLITAMLQRYARREDMLLDDVVIFAEIRQETQAPASPSAHDAVIVLTDLHLEAAVWDSEAGVLADCADGQLYTPFPPLTLIPMPRGQAEQLRSRTTFYECPLYQTASRRPPTPQAQSSLIAIIALPIKAATTPDFFTLRGTALFTNTDD